MWLDPREKPEGGNGELDSIHAHIKEYSRFAYLEGIGISSKYCILTNLKLRNRGWPLMETFVENCIHILKIQ